MRFLKGKGLADLLAGLAAALFSISEGVAYAKLAGVNPLYGLFSSMVATIAASLTVGTALMVSTLTSAIAISTRSVLEVAGIGSEVLPAAIFTLTFLMGLFMVGLGLFRLGKLVHFVSNAVMTGFVIGASALIILGQLGDLVGLGLEGSDRLEKTVYWALHWRSWNPLSVAVGCGSILLLLLLQRVVWLRKAANVIVLIVGAVIVRLGGWGSVPLVGDLAQVSNVLPEWSPPDLTLVPRLAPGAIAVSLVALFQGAGIRSAFPNKRGGRGTLSRDFIGIGIGNLFGSFFQSMGTGGSLSRTAVCVESGSQSRWAGVFSGFWLMAMVGMFGHYLQYIPIASIGGILVVIASQIIAECMQDVKLIVKSSYGSALAMGVTFGAALFIPLQWTIFFGALISFLFYIYSSATEVRFCQLVQDSEGYFEERPPPSSIPSNQVTILDFEGNLFFAQVPVIAELMPAIDSAKNAVVIWRIRGQEDLHSTFLRWMKTLVQQFKQGGNRFILEGVEPQAMQILKETGMIDLIGKENVFVAKSAIGKSLKEAHQVAIDWIGKQLV